MFSLLLQHPVGRLVAATFAGALMTGCGGGGTAPAPPPPTQSLSSTSAETIVKTAAGTQEMPTSADRFVNSIGVNVHLGDANSVYGKNMPLVESLLIESGIKHYRTGGTIGDSTLLEQFHTLAASGVNVDFVVSIYSNTSRLLSFARAIGTGLDSLEGPNEFDLSNEPNWWTTLDAYQAQLYPVAQGLHVAAIAPALTQENHFTQVGNLTSIADVANMHDYLAGRNPGTGGWGGTDKFGTYGGLEWNINIAHQPIVGKWIWATETGYSSDADPYALPASIESRYALRTLLEHWNAGVTRTYFYELFDEGPEPFSHYGLVDSGGGPKPEYRAIKRMIAHVSDPGPVFNLTPLSYSLSGNVHHLLLQRRNGTFVLILWDEAQEWNPDTRQPISISPRPVTLTFSNVPHAMSSTTFDENGEVATTNVSAARSVTVRISGTPTMVDITP